MRSGSPPAGGAGSQRIGRVMTAEQTSSVTPKVSAVREGRLLVITLNRPAEHNALDEDVARGLTAALRQATGPDVGAVLLQAAGKNFCVGGDLRSFATGPDGPAGMGGPVRSTVDAANEALLALADLDVPVVSALQGWVAGIGVSLGCAADLVLAGQSSRFRSAYTAIGFSPDGGLTWLLPRLAGATRAADFVLSNRVLSADEALAWGMVSRVVPDEQLAGAARELAAALATGPAGAQAAARRLLRRGERADLAQALAAEADAVTAQAASGEGQEGVQAFLDKRAPRFHPDAPANP
jgi:2-(1,2-epoxy-1,2-dihydrophenyl)acetyl-CoA isomerase